MSGTFPTTPGFEAVNFNINTPTLTSDTISGKRRRVGMGNSFYTFTVKFPNVKEFDMGSILGFIAAQYAGLDSFQIVLPNISYSKNPFIKAGTTSGTITTTEALTAGDSAVTISSVTSGQFLKAGDFFKFANHSKVYMCIADYTTGDLNFSGRLVANVPSGTAIIYNAVPFTVVLDNEVQQYDVGIGGISTMSLDMREVW
jgi:hypothetical protein